MSVDWYKGNQYTRAFGNGTAATITTKGYIRFSRQLTREIGEQNFVRLGYDAELGVIAVKPDIKPNAPGAHKVITIKGQMTICAKSFLRHCKIEVAKNQAYSTQIVDGVVCIKLKPQTIV